MADDTTEEALTAAETAVAAEVRAVLDEVAADIAAGLKGATEIVAARFSLSEIGRRWTARMPRIVRRLLRVAEDAGQAAASDARTELPEGWDDLPGRYDRDEPLPASLGSYVTSTEHLLRAVGDRLTEAAVAELAAGLDAGEDIDALRSRLRALFSRDGSQLGDTREERIARTESSRAWNAATLAAAEDLTGEGRPLVKQWQTRRDTKVREAHDDADGQIRLLDEAFTVGGVAMRYPGDPAAPPGLTVNCRCILRLAPEQQAAAYGSGPHPQAWEEALAARLALAQRSLPLLRARPAAATSGEVLQAVPVVAADVVAPRAPEHPVSLAASAAPAVGLGARSLVDAAEADTDLRVDPVQRQQAAPRVPATAHGAPAIDAPVVLQRGDPLQVQCADARRDLAQMVGDKVGIGRDAAVLDSPGHVMSAHQVAASADLGQTIPAVAGTPIPEDAPGVVGQEAQAVAVGLGELGVEGSYVVAGQRKLTANGSLGHVDSSQSAAPRDDCSRRRGSEIETSSLSHRGLYSDGAASPCVNEFTDHTAAADGSHLQGGMIALLPHPDDARFLALPGGEDLAELHCTLWVLGDDASDWTDDQRNELVDSIRAQAAELPGPISARTFGVNHWNPDSDSSAWVWAVGDDRDSDGPALHDARTIAVQALEDTHDRPDTPAQHSPWVAHTTAVYSAETWPFELMCERLGPVVFDRIRVAFGDDHYDIPIGPEQEEHMGTPVHAAQDTTPPPVRTWSTPGMTALAFEDEQTGDGRVFGPNALYWDGDGPWPLQYAEAMGQGHEGAELAGAIRTIGRDNPRITGSGVLYLTQDAGYDACTLLDQGAPLGVSVDLDDADVQLVDTTSGADEVVLEASFASASAMRLADGTWMISGRTGADWTASGTEMSQSARTFMMFTRPGGAITAATARRVFGDQLTAAMRRLRPGRRRRLPRGEVGGLPRPDHPGPAARRNPCRDAGLRQGPHRPRPARPGTDRCCAGRRVRQRRLRPGRHVHPQLPGPRQPSRSRREARPGPGGRPYAHHAGPEGRLRPADRPRPVHRLQHYPGWSRNGRRRSPGHRRCVPGRPVRRARRRTHRVGLARHAGREAHARRLVP